MKYMDPKTGPNFIRGLSIGLKSEAEFKMGPSIYLDVAQTAQWLDESNPHMADVLISSASSHASVIYPDTQFEAK